MPSNDENTDGTSTVEDRLERLKKFRGGQRGATTKLINIANDLIQQNTGRMDIEVLARMSSINVQLKDKRRNIEQMDTQILDKCPMTDIDREIDEATDVSTRIIEMITKLENFQLGRYSTRSDERTPGTPTTSTPTRNETTPAILERSTTSESSNSRQQIRLPKINLPRFNGDITRFQAFWQSFKCSVDENESLSDVHKLNYLMSVLEGPAYKALQGFEVTERNYAHAMETLKERFGNPQTIIGTHMKALVNLEGHANMKTTELRALYDNVNVHIRGLESLGISSDSYGCLLVPVILKRMPEDINLQVARNTKRDVWDIKETMHIIRREIEARELSQGISATEPSKAERPNKHMNTRTNQPVGTTRTFVSKGERSNKIECYFCKKEHYSNDCTIVKDMEKRKSLLMDAKRCFNCLRTGHIVRDCQNSSRCRKCNRKHNTAICDKRDENGKNEIKQTSNEGTVTTATSKEKTNVLLQTARAYVFGDDREKRVGVNVLFDGGSQKSYVAEKLKNKLSLKAEKTESINLNTFGSEKYKKQNCELVEINLELGESVVAIKALSFPTLCSPIATRVEIKDYPHLQGLQLADTFSSSDKEIGILIGADYYHDIVTGEVIKGSSGPAATSSKLGWLLSGNASVSNPKIDTISCSNVNSVLAVDTLPTKEEITDENHEITETLKEFWRHEAAGLTENVEDETQNEDPLVKLKIQFNDKEQRYEAGMSGIAVAAESVVTYNDKFQQRNAPNAILIFEIVHDKCIEITQSVLFSEVDGQLAEAEAAGFNKIPGEQKEFSLLRHILTRGDQRPRYATITLSNGNKEKVSLITWCPNDANIKKRMLTSSSKDALKKALTGIQYTMQACDEDDLCFDDIKKDL